jgi:hypothetical protein
MITETVKSTAIAKIKCQVPYPEIAEELDIPELLVKEWADKLEGNDLVHMQANIHALERMSRQTLIEPSSNMEELLKTKIEEVAVNIVNEVDMVVATADPIRAKTLQLCADTITKLYTTIVTKVIAAPGVEKPNGSEISVFKNIMRD